MEFVKASSMSAADRDSNVNFYNVRSKASPSEVTIFNKIKFLYWNLCLNNKLKCNYKLKKPDENTKKLCGSSDLIRC